MSAANWSKLINSAEKLLGGPPPFINLSSILNSGTTLLASRARNLAASVGYHPFFYTIQACLRGRRTFTGSSFVKFVQPSNSHNSHTSNNGFRPPPCSISSSPVGGLLILLVGHLCLRSAANPSASIIQHQKLAQLFETIQTAVAIHKSLVDIDSKNKQSLATDGDTSLISLRHLDNQQNNDWMTTSTTSFSDIRSVNKLATLAGDVLLASVSTTLADFHNAEVVDSISHAISDMMEAEFSTLTLSPKSSSSNDNNDEQACDRDWWLAYTNLARGSLLGHCCRSTALVSLQSSTETHPIPGLVEEFGRRWALLSRLLDERRFLVDYKASLSKHITSASYLSTTPKPLINTPIFLGYRESGLVEPTLADVYLLGRHQNSSLSALLDALNDCLDQSYCHALQLLSSQLTQALDSLTSTLLEHNYNNQRSNSIGCASQTALDLLGNATELLVGEARAPMYCSN